MPAVSLKKKTFKSGKNLKKGGYKNERKGFQAREKVDNRLLAEQAKFKNFEAKMSEFQSLWALLRLFERGSRA